MLDGGPGAAPEGPLDAWLVCDDSSELQPTLRKLAAARGAQPVVARFVRDDVEIEPRAVEHTSHPTFGYLIHAGDRRAAWLPEFQTFPDWASGADLVFADAAGWDRPIRFAGGVGGHAAALETARAARAAGVRRLVLAHVGRPTIRALDAGQRIPFGELGVEGRSYVLRQGLPGRPSVPLDGAGHELLPHTADAGIRAWAANLGELYAEAGRGLAELAADVAAPADAGAPESIVIEAADLPALAYAWLNELVSLADARAAAIGTIHDVRVEAAPLATGRAMEPSWRLSAVVHLVPLDDRLVRRRLDVKSATYHGLSVAAAEGRWTLTAYVDV
jgi:SHS2 domain-containing protein